MSASPARRANVLVVEDNDVNQRLVQAQLTRLGHRCTIVGEANLALDLLAPTDHDFDLVLMDRQLPGIDGLSATRRLRAMEGSTRVRVPVVAVTASAMIGDREGCLAAGMDDFLAKPASLADLVAVIARWVGDVTT